LRILHVINSLRPSGAERHLANILGPLKELGVENHLVTFLSGNAFEEQVRRHVHRAEFGVGRGNIPRIVAMARDVDVVHTQLIYSDILGRLAASLAGTPSVSTLVTSAWASMERPAPGWSSVRYQALRLADAATARLPLRHFAVSSPTRRAYIDVLGVPPERIEVISNTVDLAEFDPKREPSREEARAELGFAAEDFAVVTLARLDQAKALDVAIRTVALASRQRPVRMVIAGEGSERASLEALARSLAAPVYMPGRRPARTVLKAGDLFLLTSRYEGMPLSLLEAMAMGLPCLCSDIPENRETSAEAAVYAPPRDIEAFSRELVTLADDPEKRSEFSRRSLQRAQLYAADLVARKFFEGVQRALAAAGRMPR
jgi:glycosyltransferase involved in cell wall biosynthesis